MTLVAERFNPKSAQCFIKAFRGGAVGLLALGVLVGCGGPSDPEPETSGTQALVKLVTAEQYRNTLEYVFGKGVDTEVQFAPVARTEGLLSNGAATAGISGGQVQEVQGLAARVANQVVDEKHREYLIPCKPASADAGDEACATQFFTKVTRLMFRRAVTNEEIAVFAKEAKKAGDDLKDFYAGMEVALEGLLLSPEALFIVEQSEPDPDNAGQYRLDAYSLASRLSFFLWNAAPDETLLAEAESGELLAPGGVEKAVDRMLSSPRLVEGVRAFFDDMLAFDEFEVLSKDPTIYPAFTRVTADDAREQTLRTIVDQALIKDGDYRDLFTSRETFMSPALGPIYGVPAQPGWTSYEFPEDSPRAGLLTQVSFLALSSHPGRSSVTLRGMALRELFLCQTVPEPPPGVDFSVVSNPDGNYPTQRERVAVHLETPSCAGCHRITDPIGLSLEQFDGAGGYRLTENGALIDVSGGLDGFEFEGAIGLGEALHQNPELPRCLVQRVYSYGTGAPPAIDARETMNYLNERFATDGYRLRSLLKTVATSTAFSRVHEGPNAGQNQVVIAD